MVRPCCTLGQNQVILEAATACQHLQPLAGAGRCLTPLGRALVFSVGAVMGTFHASLVLLLCQEACLILCCLSSALLIYTVSVLIIQFSTP